MAVSYTHLDCDYISAMTTDDALTWMRQGPMDAAFLNLEMPGTVSYTHLDVYKRQVQTGPLSSGACGMASLSWQRTPLKSCSGCLLYTSQNKEVIIVLPAEKGCIL